MQPRFDQTKRVYPRLPAGTHPDVVRAFNDLHDNVYSLRDQVQKMQAEKTQAATPSKPAPVDNFGGIKIKTNLDSTVLVTGNSFKYNSATGQFELGP